MKPLVEAESWFQALRERDRTIASLQSKQRMMDVFGHLLDDGAREAVDAHAQRSLAQVRDRARDLALDLARTTFIELEIDDLARINAGLRELATHLDAEPSVRLDCCGDLLTFLRELREIRAPLVPRPLDEP